MSNRIYFILILSVLWCMPMHAQELPQLEDILTDLYQTFGNYQFEKPGIVIVEEEKMGAGYFQMENVIRVERKLLDICQLLGSDSQTALYFILGHELTHFYQNALSRDDKSTNFLAYAEHANATYQQERDADIQGAFLTYLCGHPVKNRLGPLLERLYIAYHLNDQKLEGYPSLRQRLHSIDQILLLHDRMVNLYDNSIGLMVLGQYDFSREGFRSLQDYYQGYEVQYNIGLSALLEAMNFGVKNIDPYGFPVEINVLSRLHKSLGVEGEKDLDLEEMWRREVLLNMARTAFVEVQRNNPTYIPAYLGFAIILALEEDFEGARKVIEKTLSVPGGKSYRYELMLIEGNIEALSNNQEGAKEIYQKIIESGNEVTSELASLNLQRINGQPLNIQSSSLIEGDAPINDPEGGILLANGTQLFERLEGNTLYYTYKGKNKSLILRREIMNYPWNEQTSGFNLYQGNHFIFSYRPQQNQYFKILNNRVLENGELVYLFEE